MRKFYTKNATTVHTGATVSLYRPDRFWKIEIQVHLGRLEFDHLVLVADIVDEANLGVNIMNMYDFAVGFTKNVLRFRQVMLPATNTSNKSMDMINQLTAVTTPNSEISSWLEQT